MDLNASPNWAIFSVGGSGGFFARTNINGSSTETQLSSALLGSPHRYRIEWGASDVRYYVDGTLAATHTADFGGTQMRPFASDFTPGGPQLSVDLLDMSPFAGSGTFESRVFDAGRTAQWGALSWNASTPADTSVALSVRTGDTATPDESWSAFSPIAFSGGEIPGPSRYIQYRAQLSTSDQASTPTLGDVSITYSTPPDTTISSGPSGLDERLHSDLRVRRERAGRELRMPLSTRLHSRPAAAQGRPTPPHHGSARRPPHIRSAGDR